MKIESIELAVELLQNSIPYPDQIKNYKFTDKAVYFSWRSQLFKLELQSGRVDEVEDSLLCGSNAAILINHWLSEEQLKRI